MNIRTIPKYVSNQQMHFNIYDVFYSRSHQRVSSSIPVMFRVVVLFQEYKHTNLVNCVTITT